MPKHRSHPFRPSGANLDVGRPHQLAAERSPLPVLMTAGEHHVVTYVNPVFVEHCGDRARVIGKPAADALSSSSPALVELLDTALREGRTLSLPDFTYAGRDGPRVCRDVLAVPVFNTREWSVGLVVTLVEGPAPARARRAELAHARDLRSANEALLLSSLREREVSESARRRAEELDAVLENMNEAVLVIDVNRGRVLVNAASRELLGLSVIPVTLQALESSELLRPNGRQVTFEASVLGRSVRGERFSSEPLTLAGSDGRPVSLLCNSSAVRDDSGHILLAILTLRDVTELRELERMREQYVSLISHDLCQPLANVSLAAQLLEAAPERRDLLPRITTNVHRMERMLRDLLDVHRFRAGARAAVRGERVDVSELLRDVAREMTDMHGDRFVVDAPEAVEVYCTVDEVRRAVTNLCSNAVKYGQAGTPILLSATRAGEHAQIAVHNSGPPIPPEEQLHLFEPYVRAGSAPQSSRGWGLGLALVAACAHAHGGSVKLKSEPGEGTTFVLELPRQGAAAR